MDHYLSQQDSEIEDDRLAISITESQAAALYLILGNGEALVRDKIKIFRKDPELADSIDILLGALDELPEVRSQIEEVLQEFEATKSRSNIKIIPK